MFVSSPENEKQTFYLNFRDLSLDLSLFYIRGKLVNIQNIAEEYKKLIGNRYIVGIENGEIVRLSFTEGDFYHLIGFKKFKQASIVRMIEDSAYSKRQFFKEVLNGNITFYKTSINVKDMDKYYVDGKWKELCEVEEDNNVSLVLKNRMPYFSYNNVMRLITGELVALFDKNLAPNWRKIDADKIFFRYMEDEKKNLNFFIRKEEKEERDCPISFFLETLKDEYLRTKIDSSELMQKKVQVTYRVVYQNGTKIKDFDILWDKVRFYYSKNHLSELYKSQKRLQEYFPSGTVVSSILIQQLFDSKNRMLEEVIREVDDCEKDYKFKVKINLYNNTQVNEEKQMQAIEIIEEYGIDVEKESIIVQENELNSLEQNIKRLKEQISVLKNQIKKCNKYMPILQKLEHEEIIYAYLEFIPEITSYEDEFIMYLISTVKIKERNVLPKEIRNIYRTYKKCN